MKRATVCLGILLAVVTIAHAQDPSSDTSDTSNRRGQTATDNHSVSLNNTSQIQPQDRDAAAALGSQNDDQSSGHETHVRLGGFVVSAGYAHFWPGA